MKNKNPPVSAIAALILSLLAYAFVPLLVRWCEVEIRPEATMFNRYWIATVILLCGQKLGHIHENLSKPTQSDIILADQEPEISAVSFPNVPNINYKILLLLMITTIASTSAAVLWGLSLTQTSIANSAVMHNLTPLFTTLAGWLFFKSQFSVRFILGTVIAVGGTIILAINDFQLDILKIQGDILAILSAVLWAINLLTTEKLRNRFSSDFIVLSVCIVGMLLTMLLTLALGEPLFPSSLQGWLTALALAIVGQIFGLGLLTYSLNYLSSGLVALVFLLDPVLTAIAAWVTFKEALSTWNAIAFGIILLGIYLGVSAAQISSNRHNIQSDNQPDQNR